MGILTNFLKLLKPEPNDFVDVAKHISENYDKLDENAKSNDETLTNLNNNKLDKGTYPGNASDLKTDIDKKEPLHNIETLTGSGINFNTLIQGRYAIDGITTNTNNSPNYGWGSLIVDNANNSTAELFYPHLKGGAIGYRVGTGGNFRDWTYLDIPSGAENKVYIQDTGTKTIGNGYWDKLVNPSALYYCVKTTTATTVTSDFVSASNIKNRNTLESLCNYTNFNGWRVWKYYDGTLRLSYPVNFGPGETGERTITFPATFTELPMPSIAIDDKGVPSNSLITGIRFLTTANLKLYTNTGDITIFVTLIGRWK